MNLLTTAAAAARLGVPRSTVQDWCQKGRFPNATKIGRDWMIPEADVERMERPARGWPKGKRRKQTK